MDKALKVVDAFTKERDPLGSYSACPDEEEHPVQDQDDL